MGIIIIIIAATQSTDIEMLLLPSLHQRPDQFHLQKRRVIASNGCT
jgi:hypothetical protein